MLFPPMVAPTAADILEEESPLLLDLCLKADTLTAAFYLFPGGIPNFLEHNMRPLVHGIMRIATCDFTETSRIPPLPVSVHLKVCAWIDLLLVHLVSYVLGREPSFD